MTSAPKSCRTALRPDHLVASLIDERRSSSDMESVSASDLERYCYCPLSWHLGRETEVRSESLAEGSAKHAAMGDELNGIVRKEEGARRLERATVYISIVATALAILGVFLFSTTDPVLRGQVLSVMALAWVLLATIILYRSESAPDPSLGRNREAGIALFAILGIATALNAIPIFEVAQDQTIAYQAVSVLLLILASLSLYISNLMAEKAERSRRKARVSDDIAYVGEGACRGEVLRSNVFNLTGRPDYVLETEEGFVPVEVKTGRTPKGPLFSHILQLAAYCQLVEENHGAVPYGLIRYEGREDVIVFDERLRSLLRTKLGEIQAHLDGAPVHRGHRRPGKCRSCSRWELCPERLE